MTKVDPEGKVAATFSVAAITDVDIMGTKDFAIGPDGDLYTMAWNPKELYVLRFSKSGTLQAKTKIAEFFTPAQLAVFANGDFLIAGRKNPKSDEDKSSPVSTPFTAIYGSSGKLKRNLTLEDDQAITEGVRSGDSRFVNSNAPAGTNRAIDLGKALSTPEGYIYLLRRMSPPVIYKVSPEGEVARMEVSPPVPGSMPRGIHYSEGRLAILFAEEDAAEQLVHIVDAKSGDALGTFDATGLGTAFACFQGDQGRFAFLGSEKGQLVMRLADAR